VHGGDERAVVRRRDAGLDGDCEEALASSVTSTGGRRRVPDWEENLLLLSDCEENFLLLPVRQALGSANAGEGGRDCDDRIGNDAYAARATAMTVAARTRRSMMRRRWTLPLNVVAYCFLTVA
jgi:hypothetical protein